MSLFTELKRRNVFRVAIFYGISAWLLLQIADLIFEVLLVPDWTLRFIFGLLIAAFPFVLAFSWAFEITPEGIKREVEVDHSAASQGAIQRKLDRLIIILLIAVLGFIGINQFLGGPAPETSEADSTVAAISKPVPAEVQSADVAKAAAEGQSIAVLPFVNMSQDQNNEYFSDGLSETLLHLLARIPELQVAARTSSFKFKGLNEDIRVIGEQLSVAHVLEGSVQRVGNRVRITAQLIKVEDGYHLWSQTYDRTLDDVFAVQDEIANSVVGALKLTLLDDTPTSAVVATDVFDDFLRAQTLIARRGTQDVKRAIELLQSVVEREPGFALAHARLARAWLLESRSGALLEQTVPNAEAAARRAIEADPKLADGYTALGMSEFYRNRSRNEAALELFQKALDLNPNDADTLMVYAQGLSISGELGPAMIAAREAMDLDPLNPEAFRIMAWVLEDGERYPEAIELLTRALESWPRDFGLMNSLKSVHFSLGNYGEALNISRTIAELDPDSFSNWQSQFEAYMDLGAVPEAGEALDRMQQLAPERAYDEAAEFELLKGNVEGYRGYLRRYAEARTWARTYRSIQLAVSEGRYDDALDEAMNSDSDDWGGYGFRRQLTIAVLAGLAGQTTIREQALTSAESLLEEILQLRRESRIASVLEARMAAAQGDAGLATEHLRLALAAGHRDFSEMMTGSDFTWLPIRQTPEFLAFVEEIQQRNEATLGEIRAR